MGYHEGCSETCLRRVTTFRKGQLHGLFEDGKVVLVTLKPTVKNSRVVIGPIVERVIG